MNLQRISIKTLQVMAKKIDTSPSYQAAQHELEEILEKLQNDQTDLDTLGLLVQRAQWLLQFCREKLRNTEIEVNKILSNES